MRGTLFRYILRLYLKFLVAIFFGVMAVFLIADFVDRVKLFLNASVLDVAELYWNKVLVSILQLGPAAMLLAGGAAISTLRKRGELTAIKALSFSSRTLYLPVGITAIVAAVGLMVFDETVATRASARIDQLNVAKFNRWGDWSLYFPPKQWFRRGDRIFYLRGGDIDSGFRDVTILTLSGDFRLVRRIDAESMRNVEGTTWELGEVVERRFGAQGASAAQVHPRLVEDLNAASKDFNIRQGRPEQMRVGQLVEQIEARRLVGLGTQRYSLALHNRFAYPLTGFAAALLAIGLALRPTRRGHLTAALVEGFMIALGLWGMMVIAKALVLAEHLPASVAAWAPFVVLFVGSVALWLRREGRLGWGGI